MLVVDDEAAVRQITRQTLEAFGYRALTARHGREGVDLYRQSAEPIDIVLTDIMMPVMDGVAAIQEIRRLNPRATIIAATHDPNVIAAADSVVRLDHGRRVS